MDSGKRENIMKKNPEIISEIVVEGSKKARQVAKQTLNEVKKAMNLDYE